MKLLQLWLVTTTSCLALRLASNTTNDDIKMPSWHEQPHKTKASVEIDFDKDNYLKELGLPSDEELGQLIQEAEEQQAAEEAQQNENKNTQDAEPRSAAIPVAVANVAPSYIQMRIISTAPDLSMDKLAWFAVGLSFIFG
ncbi:hypothetical protein THRCLA_20355 [Thraustotheca clavata]|uniref:Secreted protein n=1 Tax=Thraustotheca clavata TaxID=74557 RepID=A0A1W0A889_9STRA|nr:hypothetical protein THRCLA_20355 [Thraustotheca clavata]